MSKPKPFKGKCSNCGAKKVWVVKYKNGQLCIGDCLVKTLRRLVGTGETLPFAIPTSEQVAEHYAPELPRG